MQIIDKIITSVTQPQQTNVMWHNPDTGEFKIFGSKGWEPAGGGITINVLWKELKDLRDSAKLIPGMSYRITDYVATTSDPESRSANHPFDIIVTADDEKTLNENARAIQHEGDEYFKNCNLAAWKLKYCIDNDMNKFTWGQQEFNGYQILIPDIGLSNANIVSLNNKDHDGFPYKLIVTNLDFKQGTSQMYLFKLYNASSFVYDAQVLNDLISSQ